MCYVGGEGVYCMLQTQVERVFPGVCDAVTENKSGDACFTECPVLSFTRLVVSDIDYEQQQDFSALSEGTCGELSGSS